MENNYDEEARALIWSSWGSTGSANNSPQLQHNGQNLKARGWRPERRRGRGTRTGEDRNSWGSYVSHTCTHRQLANNVDLAVLSWYWPSFSICQKSNNPSVRSQRAIHVDTTSKSHITLTHSPLEPWWMWCVLEVWQSFSSNTANKGLNTVAAFQELCCHSVS